MVGTPGGRVPGGLVTLSRLQGRANGLPYRLPVDGALQLLSQASHDATVADEWCTFAQNTYPLMHGRVPELLRGFLQAKRAHGSAVEKALYARMTPVELVTRFLTRRPLAFLNESDDYRLPDGRTGSGGWDAIGTAEEGSLRLSELMSYDEIALAALVGVSVPTHFINKGGRFNLGEPDRPGTQPLCRIVTGSRRATSAFLAGRRIPTAPPARSQLRSRPVSPGTFERTGIYVGLVGARFERPGVMEWAHMVVTPTQNTEANGYGASPPPAAAHRAALLAAWARFYGVAHLPTYDEAREDGACLPVGSGMLLNTPVFKAPRPLPRPRAPLRRVPCAHSHTLLTWRPRTPSPWQARLRMAIETFLLEADERARQSGRLAYVHAVGLGLGVWMIHDAQVRRTRRCTRRSSCNRGPCARRTCGASPESLGASSQPTHPPHRHR